MFGNPGATELPLMDGLAREPGIHYVLALQESIAIAMADAYWRAPRFAHAGYFASPEWAAPRHFIAAMGMPVREDGVNEGESLTLAWPSSRVDRTQARFPSGFPQAPTGRAPAWLRCARRPSAPGRR
jgi:hypothetical protein